MILNIRVLTPDKIICSTIAKKIILPGLTGEIGILENHAALITALDIGLLRIKSKDKWIPIILCGGLAEVDRNQVTILANDIQELTNINFKKATKNLEEAILIFNNAKSEKIKLDAAIEVKKATVYLEAIKYLT